MELASLIAAGEAACRELDLDKALFMFEKATALDPDNMELQRNLDRTRLRRDRFRKLAWEGGGGIGPLIYRYPHDYGDRCRIHLRNAEALAGQSEFDRACVEIVASMPAAENRCFPPPGWTNWIRWQEAGYQLLLESDPGAASVCFEFALEFSLEESQYLRPARHEALRNLAAKCGQLAGAGMPPRHVLSTHLRGNLPRQRFADRLVALARVVLFAEEGTDLGLEAIDRARQFEPRNPEFRNLQDAVRRFAMMNANRR